LTFIDEKKEEATEEKIFNDGGYPALWKYKAWKMYEKLKGGGFCNGAKDACGTCVNTDQKSGDPVAS
jgi:hypothetical protein